MSNASPEPPAATPENVHSSCRGEGSHADRAAAGWGGKSDKPYDARWEILMQSRERTRWGNFAWFSPAPLLASVNDVIAKGLDDLVNARRPVWVAGQRAAGKTDLVIHRHRAQAKASFLVMGDPGEADASQYAVVAPLLAEGGDTDFMLIASDVIYPAGDINDYVDAFYLPYAGYGKPIYAIPGNHDWYDGLNGFMWHFCGAEALPPSVHRASSYSIRERIARRVWRKPSSPHRAQLLRHQATHSRHPRARRVPPQPGPYFAVEAGEHLLVVAIDTGITGVLDREQAEWLLRISDDPRPKILVTGKPIYVDNEYHPGLIDWGARDESGDLDELPTAESRGRAHRTVDDIVRDPQHRYVAAIGGDIHNYQRYSVRVRDEYVEPHCMPVSGKPRKIEYVVSGGGGAYLSATHTIPKVDIDHRPGRNSLRRLAERVTRREPARLRDTIEPVTEADFCCYPLRGDSLARFILRFGRVLLIVWLLAILFLAAGLLALLPRGLFVEGRLIDQTARIPGEPTYGEVLTSVPVVLLVVAVLGVLGVLVGRSAPRGYKALVGTLVPVGVALLLGAGFVEIWHAWTAVVMATVLAFGAAGTAVWVVLRDSGRVGKDLALALAAGGLTALLFVPTYQLLGVVLLAVALLTVVLGVFRRRRPVAMRWLTRVLACAVVVLFLVLLTRSFLEPLVLTVGALAMVLAAAVILLCSRVALSSPMLVRAQLDPDEAVRFMADRLDTPVERPVGDTRPGLRARALAWTFFSWILKRWISEIAEATRPPFFKSFLRIDAHPDRATITCFGVTGYGDVEHSPSVEDRFGVPYPPPATDRGASVALDGATGPGQGRSPDAPDGSSPEPAGSPRGAVRA
ncbi:MAG: metallophosphoesterase [Thermoleophilaceae bacterium]